jgi:hypothetical protein
MSTGIYPFSLISVRTGVEKCMVWWEYALMTTPWEYNEYVSAKVKIAGIEQIIRELLPVNVDHFHS